MADEDYVSSTPPGPDAFQSPISSRSKSPSQSYDSDNNPYETVQEEVSQQGPKDDSGLNLQVVGKEFIRGGFSAGVSEAESDGKALTRAAAEQGGKAGYASSDYEDFTGGTEEQFTSDRGSNS